MRPADRYRGLSHRPLAGPSSGHGQARRWAGPRPGKDVDWSSSAAPPDDGLPGMVRSASAPTTPAGADVSARRSRAMEGRMAMEQHVIVAELSATGAQELLALTSSAHLAYNAEDGMPRVIPVGFFWTGTEFVISTATTSPKVAALKARPDVALSIDGGDTPEQARALSVRGRASVEIVDGLVPEYL